MLLVNGQWEAKILPETSQQTLKAENKNEVIQELRKTETKPTNGGTKNGKKDGATNLNVICKKCKEKSHIAKNCPKKQAQQGGKEDTKPTNPYKVRPKDGEAQVKSHQWHSV